MAGTLNLSEIAGLFTDEDAAYLKIEAIRWPDGPVCPHCGVIDNAYFLNAQNGTRTTRTGKTTYRRLWKCGACRQQFSALVGTIFEDSKLPLHKWLYAIHLLCSGKNGVSAHELHRQLGITYKSAWFMAHRIRYAMDQQPLAGMLTGTIEADETYVGGAAKNMHKADRERRITGRGGNDKVAVFTLVQRDGEVRSQVLHETVTGDTLAKVLRKEVAPEATLMTDSFGGYFKVGKEFAAHETVNHQQDEYVRGDVTTNRAEGYFSQLKRGIDGTHHHVSEQHLQRYVREFDYRFNTRKEQDGERKVRAIQQTTGKRLRYQ